MALAAPVTPEQMTHDSVITLSRRSVLRREVQLEQPPDTLHS